MKSVEANQILGFAVIAHPEKKRGVPIVQNSVNNGNYDIYTYVDGKNDVEINIYGIKGGIP